MLLDALGTLVALEPPAPRLQRALRERLGVVVSAEEAEHAIATEIAYYRANLERGRDAASLAALRRDAAAALAGALPEQAAEAGLDALTGVLLAALEFTPYPDVVPVLRELRSRGTVLVVVSNWDVSLYEVLARTGLSGMIDAAVASAEFGVAKPHPAIFAHALALAGASPERSRHVGDSVTADVEGARAAGLEPVLIRRDGEAGDGPPPRGVRVIRSLTELLAIPS